MLQNVSNQNVVLRALLKTTVISLLPAVFVYRAAGETVPAAPHFPGPDPGPAQAEIAAGTFKIENNVLTLKWQIEQGRLRPIAAVDKLANTVINNMGEAFSVTLEDGRTIKASDLTITGGPELKSVAARPDSLRLADHYSGRSIAVFLSDADENLNVEWREVLRDGANYVRQFITLKATKKPITVKTVTMVELKCRDAEVIGKVAGSPVVADGIFFACEHPNSKSIVGSDDSSGGSTSLVRCSLARNMTLDPDRPLVQSSVTGVAPPGQMRRAFARYIELERPRPFKPFLHYNSWYDIAWGDRKMNEAQCLEVIRLFGREMTEKRNVPLDSFVFDDGWDDNKTLWGFHKGFPQGFAPLAALAEKYGSAVGVWLSPWGGYGQAKAERMEYGRTQGFEVNPNGFSLAGPKYYARFRDVCAMMIKKYRVNYFKFDGVGIGNDRDGADDEFLPDIEALLRLCAELQQLRPDIYISITTGTWPSPYWLFYGDSIWRNGLDCGFHGEGTMRQKWITYRDMITYRMIACRAPLYPLNSLMVQGICYAQLGTATRMGNDLKDIVDEIWMLFGSGTQLQELYVTPQMMTAPMWDALAQAAAWSRRNADVLADVHWIGGDPGNGEAYGYASWSPRMSILVLRNPAEKAASLNIDAKDAFELPPNAPTSYKLQNLAKKDDGITLKAGQPHTFALAPFEALVFEALPAK
ncbi:MAG: hypothetical protein JXN61_13650 [Sedimentisphaerales bacterium]|nr:hypothetical protein [Sedimentisphaerales bacterium]